MRQTPSEIIRFTVQLYLESQDIGYTDVTVLATALANNRALTTVCDAYTLHCASDVWNVLWLSYKLPA